MNKGNNTSAQSINKSSRSGFLNGSGNMAHSSDFLETPDIFISESSIDGSSSSGNYFNGGTDYSHLSDSNSSVVNSQTSNADYQLYRNDSGPCKYYAKWSEGTNGFNSNTSSDVEEGFYLSDINSNIYYSKWSDGTNDNSVDSETSIANNNFLEKDFSDNSHSNNFEGFCEANDQSPRNHVNTDARCNLRSNGIYTVNSQTPVGNLSSLSDQHEEHLDLIHSADVTPPNETREPEKLDEGLVLTLGVDVESLDQHFENFGSSSESFSDHLPDENFSSFCSSHSLEVSSEQESKNENNLERTEHTTASENDEEGFSVDNASKDRSFAKPLLLNDYLGWLGIGVTGNIWHNRPSNPLFLNDRLGWLDFGVTGNTWHNINTPPKLVEKLSLENEKTVKGVWPLRFYEYTPIKYPSTNWTKVLSVVRIFLSPNRSLINFTDEEATLERTTCDSMYHTHLLHLPEHILEKILFYLCSEEPTNRFNQDVLSFAGTCVYLQQLVYHSTIPDYMEMGLNTKGALELVQFNNFLQKVNWKITKFRLLIMAGHLCWVSFFAQCEGHFRHIFQLSSLEEFILDFSECCFYERPALYYGFFSVDFSNILRGYPHLKSFTVVTFPRNDIMKDVKMKINHKIFANSFNQYPSMDRYILKDLGSSHTWGESNRFMVTLNRSFKPPFPNIKHVSFNFMTCYLWNQMNCLKFLTSVRLSDLKIGKRARDLILNNMHSGTPLMSVRHLVISNSFNYGTQASLVSVIFPNLQSYETVFRRRVGFEEIVETCRQPMWNFRHLSTVMIFIRECDFSDHLESLKSLFCLKNLCIEFWHMSWRDYTNVAKLFNPKALVQPTFNLELFRLECQSSDLDSPKKETQFLAEVSSLDSFVEVASLFSNILLIGSLQVCVMFSYSDKKEVYPFMEIAVMNHPKLNYVRYGKHVLKYPESNHSYLKKLRYCRPRLHLTEF